MWFQILCALLSIATAVVIGLAMPLNCLAILLAVVVFGLLNGWWAWPLLTYPDMRHHH